MRRIQGNERQRALLLAGLVLPGLSALFLWIEHLTHFEFLLHVAAIPLEILVGALLVERWMAGREKEGRRRQLMYLKSYLFRSEMRNVFISNFAALARPALSLEWIRSAGTGELIAARDAIGEVAYRSDDEMERVVGEYVHARHVFQTFMEWAVEHDFEPIFHDMIYILHFIQDVQLLRREDPDRPFMAVARTHPRLLEKTMKILRDGVVKFLDYAIELRQKEPEVLEELLDDYLLSSRMRA